MVLFIKIYTTEMDAKPVFDCLLGAFNSEGFWGSIYLQSGTGWFFYGNWLKANRNFQFEFARACCQVLVFILPNKTIDRS